MSVERLKLVIDTDPGVDDSMALMMACGSEAIVMAVTTVAGNVPVEVGAGNATYIVNQCGRSEIEVYSGADQPLKRELVTAKVHGIGGLGEVMIEEGQYCTGGVKKITELAQIYGHELSIVALAPLTNLALALDQDRISMESVKQVVMMGGTVSGVGNKSAVAEYNFWVDPEAADLVIRSKMPKVLIPLDVCDQVIMGIDEFKGVVRPQTRELLMAMLEPYFERLRRENYEGVMMYDPLAMFYALYPEYCQTKSYAIVGVETSGELTRGMLVADRRRRAFGEHQVDVVERIDRDAFVRVFTELLNKTWGR